LFTYSIEHWEVYWYFSGGGYLGGPFQGGISRGGRDFSLDGKLDFPALYKTITN